MPLLHPLFLELENWRFWPVTTTRLSVASTAPLLLGLIAGISLIEAANYHVLISPFTVDLGNGRGEPTTLLFTYRGARSIYTFDDKGHITTLAAGPITYQFPSTVGETLPESGSKSLTMPTDDASRMLPTNNDKNVMGSDTEEEPVGKDIGVDEDVEIIEMAVSHRRLYACPDCEEDMESLCGVGLDTVCYWVPYLSLYFRWGGNISMNFLCRAFQRRCDKGAAWMCDRQCTLG